MRELRFRAWFHLQEKMVQHENLELNYHGNEGFTFAFDKETDDGNGNVLGTLNYDLMQYTGLKDKNGKEIYEGDLYESCGKKYIVRFGVCPDNGITCFFLENAETDFTTYTLVSNPIGKVIGNIYENPELLNEK